MKENMRTKGTYYENMACDFLMEKGYGILERNYRCRMGEIDIIAKDHSYLVFLEVKYRKNNHAGNPVEAVDVRKMQRISTVANYYRISHKIPDNQPIRFDVLAILGDHMTHYENAFEYMGRS